MKTKVLLLALFVAGFVVSLAIAAPPPGRGHGKHDVSTATSTGGTTTGGTTTGTTTGGTTTSKHGDRKVALCHKTGSGKRVRIEVSKNAVPAHMRHGDTLAGAGGCSSTTTTGTTTTP